MKIQYTFELNEENDDSYEIYLVQHAKNMAVMIHQADELIRTLCNHPEYEKAMLGDLKNTDYVSIDKLSSWWYEKLQDLLLDLDRLIK